MSSALMRSLGEQKKQGFLLIEVLIGLSMLSVVALAVGGYFHAILNVQAEGMQRLKALSIARTTMEHVCAGNLNLIVPKQDQFSVEWELMPEVHSEYSRAQVIVSWYPHKGAIRTVTLESGVLHEHA